MQILAPHILGREVVSVLTPLMGGRTVRFIPAGETDAGADGIRLPVRVHGGAPGVVVVEGDPDALAPLAGLLDGCIGLCVDAALRRVRHEAMRRLLEDGDADGFAGAGVDAVLPVRMLAIAPAPSLRRVVDLCDGRDLVDEWDGVVLICRHAPTEADAEAGARALHEALCRELGEAVSMGVGSVCATWPAAAASAREAMALCRTAGGACLCVDAPAATVQCLMRACHADAAGHVRRMEEALRRGFGAGSLDRVMCTIEAYCEADCSGGRAAAALGVHKNTMNYRMNKIMVLLGLEDETPFVKEFHLRLLLLHDRARR